MLHMSVARSVSGTLRCDTLCTSGSFVSTLLSSPFSGSFHPCLWLRRRRKHYVFNLSAPSVRACVRFWVEARCRLVVLKHTFLRMLSFACLCILLIPASAACINCLSSLFPVINSSGSPNLLLVHPAHSGIMLQIYALTHCSLQFWAPRSLMSSLSLHITTER